MVAIRGNFHDIQKIPRKWYFFNTEDLLILHLILYNQTSSKMKKLLLTTALVAIFAFGANAQEQGDIRAQLGLGLGTKAAIDDNGFDTKMGIGLNIGGEYLISDAISIAPSYTMFFKSTIQGVDFKNSEINVDARYYFGDGGLYGLAGLSHATAKAEGNGGSIKSTKTGLNIGAGIMMPLGDTMFLNGQVKYNTPFEQLEAQVGIAFAF